MVHPLSPMSEKLSAHRIAGDDNPLALVRLALGPPADPGPRRASP